MTRLLDLHRFGIRALLALVSLLPCSGIAATCNSIDPGNWSFTGNWSCNQVPDAGDDVTISHAISLNNADRTARNFTIATGGQLTDTGNTLTVSGTVVINGTWTGSGGGQLTKTGTGSLSGTGSITGNTRINIDGNTSILNTANLTFTDVANGRIDIGAGITVTNNGTVTLARLTEDGTASTWINAANSTLNVRADVFPAGGVLTASASGNTVNYSGTVTQTVLPVSYHHLTLTGSGSKTIGTAAGQSITIAGDLTLGAGTTYAGNTFNPVIFLGRNFTNNGTFNSGTGTYVFNGTALQTLTGPAGGTTTFSGQFRVSNASGLSFFQLPASGVHVVRVNNTVSLLLGRITTNGNVLYIGNTGGGIANAGSGAGTAADPVRFVIGNLRKAVGLGAAVSRSFEVGTNGGNACCYARVVATFNVSGGIAGDVTVSTTVDPTTGHHPNIGTSTLDGNKSVNRYWTFTNNSVTFNASGTNTFVLNFNNPADLDAGVNTGNFFVSRYIAPNWTEITPTGRTGTSTTIQIPPANLSGDYQIAEKPAAPPTPASFDAFETSLADTATPKVIRTKVASGATGFTLSIMAISAGVKQTTFTGTGANVKVELIGANTLGTLTAANCPTAAASMVLQTIASFAISNGRSDVTFAAVPNSWRDVRVRISYPTTSPTVTVCSSDNFAIRPASFTAAVTDSDWSTAGTARALDNTVASGGRVHKAGQPLTITLTPSPATTTNYTDRTIAVGALTCVLAGTCTTSMLNVGAFTGNGTQVSTTATFSEAGAFNLSLQDQDYASVDSGDTAGDCTASGRYVCDSGAPRAVGRFVPDHFAVIQVTAPKFRTFDTTNASCSVPPSGPQRSFTYIGQSFGYETPPAAMIEARNAKEQITANYRGTLWKLTNASAVQQFGNSPAKALDLTQAGSPTVAETPNSGTGTLTPAATGKLAFQRDNSTPQAEFNASLSLSLSVSDASEAGANQGTITTTTPQPLFSNIAFDGDGAASGKTFYYGRLQMGTARGEQGATLQVPLETQFWNGTTSTFTRNTADYCTTLVPANFGLGNYAGNLDSAKASHAITGAFISGQKSLAVSVPGSGSVEVVANLGATMDSCTTFKPVPGTTGASQSWLRGRWSCSTTHTKDPTGRATFGVRLGSEELIYFRENF